MKIKRESGYGEVELVDHREPPVYRFRGKRNGAGRQLCPLCGRDAGLKRGWWHPECAAIWALSSDPRAQIHELIQNCGPRCWSCGSTAKEATRAHAAEIVVTISGVAPTPWQLEHVRTRPLELEHIRPLYSLTDEERGQLRWWLPFNLQLLCHWCHAAKTAREARERYATDNPDGALARRMDYERKQLRLGDVA